MFAFSVLEFLDLSQWLPVSQRIDFKILMLVYKTPNGFGPKYISDLLPRLRSSGTGLLSVPRVRAKHGEAAFGYNAPRIWNKLPENLLQLSPLLNQD